MNNLLYVCMLLLDICVLRALSKECVHYRSDLTMRLLIHISVQLHS